MGRYFFVYEKMGNAFDPFAVSIMIESDMIGHSCLCKIMAQTSAQ